MTPTAIVAGVLVVAALCLWLAAVIMRVAARTRPRRPAPPADRAWTAKAVQQDRALAHIRTPAMDGETREVYDGHRATVIAIERYDATSLTWLNEADWHRYRPSAAPMTPDTPSPGSVPMSTGRPTTLDEAARLVMSKPLRLEDSPKLALAVQQFVDCFSEHAFEAENRLCVRCGGPLTVEERGGIRLVFCTSAACALDRALDE